MSDCYYGSFDNGGGSRSWDRQGMLSFCWTFEPWKGMSVGVCPVARISGGAINCVCPRCFIFYFFVVDRVMICDCVYSEGGERFRMALALPPPVECC